MNGHLIQLRDVRDDRSNLGLYWSPIRVDKVLMFSIYQEFYESEDFCENFEDYWNERNEFVQIERVFVDEIYV